MGNGNREVTLGTALPTQDGEHKEIFAEETNKSKLSWNSYGLLDAVKRWSCRNKKNIAIFTLILSMFLLLGLNLGQMATFRANQINGEIQENNILENMKVAMSVRDSGHGTLNTIDLNISSSIKRYEHCLLVPCRESCMDMDLLLASNS